jgi:hypothetical protein
VTFRLRIPRRAHGPLFVTIHGPSESSIVSPSGAALAAALASALGSSSGPASSAPPISSLPELRQAVAGIAHYDGLYASIPGQARRRIYRDPSLVITGRTQLGFVVNP